MFFFSFAQLYFLNSIFINTEENRRNISKPNQTKPSEHRQIPPLLDRQKRERAQTSESTKRFC